MFVGQIQATDQRLLDEIRAEATHQIRRLAVHPSVVVWCGNNEVEWIYWDDERDRAADIPDHHLFHLVLPDLLAAEDPTRFYWPSTPFSPDGADPNADDVGNQHPWNWERIDSWDIRDYRHLICRFATEGGILGQSALPTIEACLPAGHSHAAVARLVRARQHRQLEAAQHQRSDAAQGNRTGRAIDGAR